MYVSSKLRNFLLIIVLFCIFAFFSDAALALYSGSSNFSPEPQFIPNELIIKFKSDVSQDASQGGIKVLSCNPQSSVIENLNAQYGVTDVEKLFDKADSGVRIMSSSQGLSGVYKVTFSQNVDIQAVAEECSKDPDVEYAEPNGFFLICITPNDPDFHRQWGLTKILASDGWDSKTGDPSIVIAVVDTGVDYNHQDLKSNIWSNEDEIKGNGIDDDGNGYVDDFMGWDFVSVPPSWVAPGEDPGPQDNNPSDFVGHGTHVSGIAAGRTNNGVGAAGTTWNCKIMPVRAGYKGADGKGYLELDDAAAAIIYAADNGADIISCSWGTYYDSQTIRKAVEYAYNAGAILVAAAGNQFTDEKLYPAAYEEVMAISAINNMGGAAFFSNFGDWIELAAPGTDIYSTTFNDSYGFMSGTSAATPFVAGVAALILTRFSDINNNMVRAQLHFSSDDLGETGFDIHFGYGRVNAKEAVELDQEAHDLTIFEMTIDSIALVGKPVCVDVTVLNAGTLDKHNVAVQFLINNTLVKSENIVYLASAELERINFLWDTSNYTEGHYNLTAYVVPVNGENRTKNNSLSKKVFVRIPSVINVPRNFATIQEAVDEAFEGDTVMVASGNYHENVFIYKDYLKLIGKGASTTTIDGCLTSDVISVWEADHVEICGFTVKNSRRSATREPPFSGILVYYSQNVNITDVSAVNNRGGVFLYVSNNVTLKENRMEANKFNFGLDGVELSNFIHNIDESNTVNGKPLHCLINENDNTVSSAAGCVVLVNSTNIEVENLELAENYFGILCIASSNVTLANLEVSLNHKGVYLRNCTSVVVHGGNLTRNYVGVGVVKSENVTMKNNFISGSTLMYTYTFCIGIEIKYSTKCQAKFNSLTRNYVNLWLYSSNENVVTKNGVSSALSSGMTLTDAHDNLLIENRLFNNTCSGCMALNVETSFNNSIYYNSFMNNTHNVLTIDSANTFDNGYPGGGNFWDDYTGTDLYSGSFQNETGSDGIGDTPYVIDSSNMDNYPLMQPLPVSVNVEVELKTLDMHDRNEWLDCIIESPFLRSYDLNSFMVSIVEPFLVYPEGMVLGDHNNNGMPDLLIHFNPYKIIDYAILQIMENAGNYKIYGGFAFRVTLKITGNFVDAAFEIEEIVTVVSSAPSVPI